MAIRVGVSRGAVLDYIANKYRGIFNTRMTSLTTVVNVVTELVDDNPERVALIVFNQSVVPITIRPIASPSTTVGIQLAASGGMMVVDLENDFVMPALRWEGVSTIGGATITIIEVVREIEVSAVEVTS